MKRQDFNPDLVAIGTRIRIQREELGLTQQELADMLGINRNTLSRYENGEIEMKIGMLFLIAEVLQTTIYYFLNSGFSNEEIDVLQDVNMLNDRNRKITFKALKAFVWSLIDNS